MTGCIARCDLDVMVLLSVVVRLGSGGSLENDRDREEGTPKADAAWVKHGTLPEAAGA